MMMYVSFYFHIQASDRDGGQRRMDLSWSSACLCPSENPTKQAFCFPWGRKGEVMIDEGSGPETFHMLKKRSHHDEKPASQLG